MLLDKRFPEDHRHSIITLIWLLFLDDQIISVTSPLAPQIKNSKNQQGL